MRRLLSVVVGGLLLVGATACGDDGGSVRDLGGSASGTGASGSAPGSGSATAETPCSPVGTDLEADAVQTVEMVATDFAYDPDALSVTRGVVTFAVENKGASNHELAFLPGGGAVPVVDGVPDEAALEEAGAFELEGFSPDQTCNATFDLAPGDYTLFCVIVDEESGETHYEKGMFAELTVTG